MSEIRNSILSILENHISKSYISVASLQADGRLHLNSACINILNPKQDEIFYILNDNNSIVISRNVDDVNSKKIISTIRYGSGISKKKWRLRIPQVPVRSLLSAKVGLRAFEYNNSIAISAEPYIPPASLKNLSSIEDLAPYMVKSNEILHLECISANQNIIPNNLKFKILGEYVYTRQHINPLDDKFTLLPCKGYKCCYCDDNFVIAKSTVWFPVIAYHKTLNYPMPALLSFRVPVAQECYLSLMNECDSWATSYSGSNKYYATGFTDYNNGYLWDISSNEGSVSISYVGDDNVLTAEEKGLMKIAHKDICNYINKI